MKHTAKVPQTVSELFQWEKVSSKASFFPSLICFAYRGLGSSGFKSDGKVLGFMSVPHDSRSWSVKLLGKVSAPCSVLIKGIEWGGQSLLKLLCPPINQIN